MVDWPQCQSGLGESSHRYGSRHRRCRCRNSITALLLLFLLANLPSTAALDLTFTMSICPASYDKDSGSKGTIFYRLSASNDTDAAFATLSSHWASGGTYTFTESVDGDPKQGEPIYLSLTASTSDGLCIQSIVLDTTCISDSIFWLDNPVEMDDYIAYTGWVGSIVLGPTTTTATTTRTQTTHTMTTTIYQVCMADIDQCLDSYLAKTGTTGTYECWISQLHPENLRPDCKVDHRFYLEDSEYRVRWNAKVDQTRFVYALDPAGNVVRKPGGTLAIDVDVADENGSRGKVYYDLSTTNDTTLNVLSSYWATGGIYTFTKAVAGDPEQGQPIYLTLSAASSDGLCINSIVLDTTCLSDSVFWLDNPVEVHPLEDYVGYSKWVGSIVFGPTTTTVTTTTRTDTTKTTTWAADIYLAQPQTSVFYSSKTQAPVEAGIFLMFFLAALLVPLAAAFPLKIDDVRTESIGLVVTTARTHWVRRHAVCMNAKMRFHGTRVPALDLATTPFTVRALDANRLLVKNSPDVPPYVLLDSSMGTVRLDPLRAPFCTGIFVIPTAALMLVLVAGIVSATLLADLWYVHTFFMLLPAATLLAICVWWVSHTPTRRMRSITRFQNEVRKTKPWTKFRSSCPAERAIQAGQLCEFFEKFRTFLKDRNTYYCVANFIEPITQREKLSYADFVGSGSVDFFVSHFWGGIFSELVDSIKSHAQLCSQPDWEQTRYWICSFSNNQWNLQDEMPGTLENSSFYLALWSQSCRGTVMVMDQHAWPMTRVWCLFELVQTFKLQAARPGDFAGIEFATPVGLLSSGISGVDTVMAMAGRLANLKLEDAKAAREDDKRMIDSEVQKMPGGFPFFNNYIRERVREALQNVHASFEADFVQTVAALRSAQHDSP